MGMTFNPYGVNPQQETENLQDLLVNSSQIGGLDVQPVQDYQPVSVGAGKALDPFSMQSMPGYGVPSRLLSVPEIEQRDKFSSNLREIAKIQSLVEAASIEDEAKKKAAQDDAFAREVRRIELAESAEQRRRDGWELFGPGGIASYKGISGAVAESTRGEPLMAPQDAQMLGDILGKEGGFESLRRNYSMENANILRRMPLLGGGFGYVYDREIREAKERLANKDISYGADPESDPQYRLDVDAVTRHENDQNLLAARGQTFMGKTAEIAGQSLPYALEFGLAGGPASKLASRVVGGGKSTAAKAGRVLVDTAGRTAVAFPRSFEQSERFQEEYEVIPNELGELEARLTEAGDSDALALFKGVASMYREMLFERGGEVAGHLSKAIMKAIPDGASRKYLEDAAKRVGSSKFGKAMEVLNQYGIQGPFAEYYLEEYPVGIVDTLVGLDVEAQRSGESFADRLADAAAPSFVDEQAPALAAFAIPMLGAAGLSGVAQAQQNARRKWLMENSDRLVEEYGIHPKRAEQIAAEFGKGNRDSAIRMVQEERTKMYLRQELSKPLAEKEGEINPDDIKSTYQDLKESGFGHSDIMREINIRLKARYKAERQAFARMSALEGDSKKTEEEAEASSMVRGQGDLLVEEMRSKYGATDSVALEIFRRLGNAAQTPEEVRDVQLQVAQYIGTTGLTPIEGGMPSVEQLRAEAEEQDAIQVGEAEAVPLGEGAGGGPQVGEGVQSEIEKIEKAIAEKEAEGQVADEVVEPTTGAMGQQPGGDQGVGPEVSGAGQPGIVQPGVAPVEGGEQQVQQEAAPQVQQPESGIVVTRGDQVRSIDDADRIARRSGSEAKKTFDQVRAQYGDQAGIEYASTIGAKEFTYNGNTYKKVGGRWWRKEPGGMKRVSYSIEDGRVVGPENDVDVAVSRFVDPVGWNRIVDRSARIINEMFVKTGMEVRTIDSIEEVAGADRQTLEQKIEEEGVSPEGVYFGSDAIYMFRSFTDPRRALTVAMHELGGHGGLDAFFDYNRGAKQDFMISVWNGLSTSMRRDAASILGRTASSLSATENRAAVAEAVEELMVTSQEYRETNPSVYRKIRSAIREIVRRFVNAFNKRTGSNVKAPSYSQEDIDVFMGKIRQGLRSGRLRAQPAAAEAAPVAEGPRPAALSRREKIPVATSVPEVQPTQVREQRDESAIQRPDAVSPAVTRPEIAGELGAGRDRDAGRQPEGVGLAPLKGVPLGQVVEGPDPGINRAAEEYARRNGIKLTRQPEYVKVDRERARRIAQAYEEMPHQPNDPVVKEAYDDLIRQTRDQYDVLQEMGYEFSFFDAESDPYGGPWNAVYDLRNNKRMAVFATYAGFGTEGITDQARLDNPMLQDTGLRWMDQAGVEREVTANDLFRAVHDAFGHSMEGAGFRARGEENAWQAHVRMYYGPAVAAMTSETRGQNSWVNFGPYAERNVSATSEETVFAEQKTGIMPEWTWMEGRAGEMPEVADQDIDARVGEMRDAYLARKRSPGSYQPYELEIGIVTRDGAVMSASAANKTGLNHQRAFGEMAMGSAHFHKMGDMVVWTTDHSQEDEMATETYYDRKWPGELTHQAIYSGRMGARWSGRGPMLSRGDFDQPMTKEGRFKGAPKWINAPSTRGGRRKAYNRLRERLSKLVEEGRPGRFWYEDSGRAVLRMFNNNVVEAEKFIELLAIYSPQASVEVNTYFALRAYIQHSLGMAIEDFKVKTASQDKKATSVLYLGEPWAGRKTDNFYKNIMYVLLKELPPAEVSKLKLDPEVYEEIQKPVTVDMWVYRAFGYDSDALTDVAGTGAFGFAERELNRISEEFNASLQEGEEPYLPHQIQAMLWTSIKARAENKDVKRLTEEQSIRAGDMRWARDEEGKKSRVFSGNEAEKRHMQRWRDNALALPDDQVDVSMAAGAFDRFINSAGMSATWEAVPSTSFEDGRMISSLGYQDKYLFTKEASGVIIDQNGNDMLAERLGLPISRLQQMTGGYSSSISPNVITTVYPIKPQGEYDDDAIRAYARAIQYIYRQDAVPWMRYIKYGAEKTNGYFLESPSGSRRYYRTQAEAQAARNDRINSARESLNKARSATKPNESAIARRLDMLEEAERYRVGGVLENYGLVLDFRREIESGELLDLQRFLSSMSDYMGYTQISPSQVLLVNFRDTETGLPGLTDEDFSSNINERYEQQAIIQEIHSVGEYGPVHDWAEDIDAGTLLSSSPRITPDIQDWIRGRRVVSEEIQRKWAGVAASREPTPSLSGGQGAAFEATQAREIDTGRTPSVVGESAAAEDPAANPTGEGVARLSRRTSAPPQKTVKAYKLFRTLKSRPGEIFPLFIGRNDPVEVGDWYDADMIPTAGFAVRPGWHAGVLPTAPHLMKKDGSMPPDRVWAEVEISADNNYQMEADQANTRDIRDRVPKDGFYRFRTNKMQGGAWIIGGSMRVNRILSNEEAASIAGSGRMPALSRGGRAPIFYSEVERTVENARQPSAPAAQWMAWLSKQPGVKKEELEWMGVEEWLKSQGRPVKRQELLDFIAANKVEVREVVLGQEELTLTPEEEQTKYGDYQLPGGENYREVLLTLPVKAKYFELKSNEDGSLWWVETSEGNPVTNPVESKEFAEWSIRIMEAEQEGVYKSPHWTDVPNILASVRMNERTDADGKRVLFIEEVQSDWHQEGRKKGYAGTEYLPEGFRLRQYKDNLWAVVGPSGRILGSGKSKKDAIAVAEKNRQGGGYGVPKRIPDAPLKSSWPVLAVKRMIRWASENGFDRIAWTTGEQQAERYDLGKRVDAIYAYESPDGTYMLVAEPMSRAGEVVENIDIADGVTKDRLADYVGKDLAERIINNPSVSERYSGGDLKVGGEGMKGFYDKILPAEVNKYVKKWGGRADKEDMLFTVEADLMSGEEADSATLPVWSLELTPAMREAAMAGQPMFSRRRVTPEQDAAYMDAVSRGDMEAARKMVDDAASLSGFTEKVFHGNPQDDRFTIFDNYSWFTDDKQLAETYGAVRSFYLNPLKSKTLDNNDDVKPLPGIDTVIGDESDLGLIGKIFLVKNPNQVKSSDTVTYDDQGNIIPLSQRFNVEEEDIRFSRRRDRGADFRVAEATLGAEIYGMKKGRAEGIKEGMRAGADQAKKKADEKLARLAKQYREELKAGVQEARLGGEIYGKKKGRAEGRREGMRVGERIGKEKGKKSAERVALRKINGLIEKDRAQAVIRAKMVEAVKDLPQSARGKYLVAVRDAKTPKNLMRVVSRVRKDLEGIEKRGLISEIKSLADRFQKSPSVAVDYRIRISELMGDILTSKPTEATIRKAQSLQAYIERQRLAGNPIEVPARTLKRLRVLSGKPLQDMSLGDLASLKAEIERLVMLGKSKLQRRINIDGLMKDSDAKDIVGQSQGINSRRQVVSPPDMPSKIGDDLRNTFNRALDRNRMLRINTLPIDVVMDMMDNGDGTYDGPIFNTFKRPVDDAYNSFIQRFDAVQKEILDKKRELGINKFGSRRIGVYAADQQATGREKLRNLYRSQDEFMSDEQIDAEIDSVIARMTPQEVEFYDFMRQRLDAVRPELRSLMREMFNEDLVLVENYFPFRTDYEAMQSDILGERISDSVGWKKMPETGMLQKRRGAGRQAIQVDAIQIYLDHMKDVTYLLEVGPHTKYMRELLDREDVRSAVGDVGHAFIRDWIDTVARMGGVDSSMRIPALDKLRRNVGVGILGLKATTALVNITPVINAVPMVGPGTIHNLGTLLVDKEWRKFVVDNMPEIAGRVGNDPQFVELYENNTWDQIREKIATVGFYPIQRMDLWAAASVGITAYKKYLRENGIPLDLQNPNLEAVRYAERMVRRTQSSGMFKDVPLAISRGRGIMNNKSLNNAILQFTNFTLNQWSLLTYEGSTAVDSPRDALRAFGIWAFTGISMYVGQLMRMGYYDLVSDLFGGGGDDDRTVADRMLTEGLSGIPYISPFMGAVLYGGQMIPVFDTVVSTGGGLVQFMNGILKDDEEKIMRGLVSAGTGAGKLMGVPGMTEVEKFAKEALVPERKRSIGAAVENLLEMESGVAGRVSPSVVQAEARLAFEEALMNGYIDEFDENGLPIDRGVLERSFIQSVSSRYRSRSKYED